MPDEHEPERVPDLTIIGAPKCATTSLARWLGEEDDVFVPPRKEMRFLDRHWTRGISWYSDQFAAASTCQWLIDATPTYLAHPAAVDRAKQVGLSRFVVVVRDPLERLWSHYMYMQQLRPGEARYEVPFSTLIGAELDEGCPSEGFLTHGRYATHLDRWAAAFGRRAILVLDFRDVTRHPQLAVEAVRDFAGWPPPKRTVVDAGHHNVGYRLRMPTIRAFIGKHHLLDRRWSRRVALSLDRLNRRPLPPMHLDDDLVARLNELYLPDTEALQSWVSPLGPD